MSQVLRERVIVMLTAGMSIRAVARELNVNFSTISRIQHHFREFGSTSRQPRNHGPRVTTLAQDLHIWLLHLWDCLRPATQTANETVDLHNQRISAQTVRNCLREAHLRAHCPHQGQQFGVVTDFSGKMLTFDGHWHTRKVCSSRMNRSVNCTGQMADSVSCGRAIC
uniref:Transposase n=1 Tax=Oncorhynchus tshawytscha TaxID=74940 RepID=A0AAZ3PD94_ONCTS